MFKKIYILLIAALIILLASSVSFIGNRDIPAGSILRAAAYDAASYTPIIKAAANTEAESLPDGIENNVEKASEDIYEAYKAEKASSQSSLPAAGPVNMSGIEAEIASLINSTRQGNGVGALAANQMLTDIARSRSNDMIFRNYFSHHTPEGENITHIFSRYGVSYTNFGENLGNASPASYGSAGAFINAWLNSPSHRANMLKGYYSLIGVGVADGNGRRVVTVLFIR